MKRAELYERVWAEPATTVAAAFGMSSVGLAKICAKHNVPTPPRGYWAKPERARAKLREPLPPRGFGQSQYVDQLIRRTGSRPSVEPPQFEESPESVRARAAEVASKAKVRSDPLTHPVIARLLEADKERAARWGKTNFYSDRPLFDSKFERRRLKVVGMILQLVDQVGGDTYGRAKDPPVFRIGIGDQGLDLEAEGPGKPVRGGFGWRDTSSVQSDALELRVGTALKFKDEPGRPLERQGQTILAALLVYAEETHRQRQLEYYEWSVRWDADMARHEAERVEAERVAEEKRLAAVERAKVRSLLRLAADYQRALAIREFVRLAEAAGGSAECPEKFEMWASAALGTAQRLDPFAAGKRPWETPSAAQSPPAKAEPEDPGSALPKLIGSHPIDR